MNNPGKQAGVTLVELIISVVIVGIAAVGVLMVVTQSAGASADPMIRQQGIAIGQAYMEEILLQALNDPDGGETGGAEAGETRPTYDDVSDYNGLSDNTGARDQSGGLVAGLEGYNVTVSVIAATLAGNPAKRVQVTVSHDGDPGLSLPFGAYKLN